MSQTKRMGKPRRDSNVPVEPAVSPDLSRRLRQTLNGLLHGLSEKQIARELSMSPHTIHCYVKQLYARYAVNARSELLALWIRDTGQLDRERPLEDVRATLKRLHRERLTLAVELARLDQQIAAKQAALRRDEGF
jgi:DNA-binding CsgD family transcriptional regulator